MFDPADTTHLHILLHVIKADGWDAGSAPKPYTKVFDMLTAQVKRLGDEKGSIIKHTPYGWILQPLTMIETYGAERHQRAIQAAEKMPGVGGIVAVPVYKPDDSVQTYVFAGSYAYLLHGYGTEFQAAMGQFALVEQEVPIPAGLWPATVPEQVQFLNRLKVSAKADVSIKRSRKVNHTASRTDRWVMPETIPLKLMGLISEVKKVKDIILTELTHFVMGANGMQRPTDLSDEDLLAGIRRAKLANQKSQSWSAASRPQSVPMSSGTSSSTTAASIPMTDDSRMTEAVHIPLPRVRYFVENGMAVLNDIKASSGLDKIVDPGLKDEGLGKVFRLTGTSRAVGQAVKLITAELGRLIANETTLSSRKPMEGNADVPATADSKSPSQKTIPSPNTAKFGDSNAPVVSLSTNGKRMDKDAVEQVDGSILKPKNVDDEAKGVPKQPERKEYVICADSLADFAFVPCGHRHYCKKCAKKMFAKKKECPMCRSPSILVMKIFVD
ncbi:hypothetical protein BV898_15339 [Hypsibius exemplaris]|uniref:RING-type domain-containing protein n=1 Tax=Hypsibius exemplaris TaxID=2072580 RepID=A0A9X6NCI9_HYPEX|nr:hypothetical protein BV898_15339 [Hypsibius exemplaris]